MAIKRILVPVDGTELTDKAVRTSIRLASQLGATIVGYIAGPLAAMASSPTRPAQRPGEMPTHDVASEAQARPLLAYFAEAAQTAGVPFEGVLDQVPDIDKAIIAAAEAHGCDMIVMVTHGRGPFGEFVFGSHTKAVLAGSKLPLLILR